MSGSSLIIAFAVEGEPVRLSSLGQWRAAIERGDLKPETRVLAQEDGHESYAGPAVGYERLAALFPDTPPPDVGEPNGDGAKPALVSPPIAATDLSKARKASVPAALKPTASESTAEWRRGTENGDLRPDMIVDVPIRGGDAHPVDRVRQLRASADRGDAGAMRLLGARYANGHGVQADPAESNRWYLAAANAGDRRAISLLSARYASGDGVEADPVAVARWLRAGADKGDAQAMNSLADCYDSGDGVDADPTEAARWYQAAAAKGHPAAMRCLGVCYELGEGLESDPVEAARWYQKAAAKGDVIAMYNLGLCYEAGVGVEADVAEAIKWFEAAAVLGDEDAASWLARNSTNAEPKPDDNADVGNLGDALAGALGSAAPATVDEGQPSEADEAPAQDEATNDGGPTWKASKKGDSRNRRGFWGNPEIGSLSPFRIGAGVTALFVSLLVGYGWWAGRADQRVVVIAYAVRPVNIRTGPGAAFPEKGQLQRGQAVTGIWKTAANGPDAWLKVTEGPHKKRYIWGRNLSETPPPLLTYEISGERAARTSASMLAMPDPSAEVIETARSRERFIVVGVTGSWVEVLRRSGGGVGYMPYTTFQRGAAGTRRPRIMASAAVQASKARPATGRRKAIRRASEVQPSVTDRATRSAATPERANCMMINNQQVCSAE